jgi:chromosome segregation ATPase
MARGAIDDIYRAGMQAEAERTRAATERLAMVLSDQDAQIIELEQDNARLLIELASRSDRIAALEGERGEMEGRLAAAGQTIEELRTQVGSERDSAAGHLRDALARFEVLVEEATSMRQPRRAGPKVNTEGSDG